MNQLKGVQSSGLISIKRYGIFFLWGDKTNLYDGSKEYLSAKLNGMELITVLETTIYLIRGQLLGGWECSGDVSSTYLIAMS